MQVKDIQLCLTLCSSRLAILLKFVMAAWRAMLLALKDKSCPYSQQQRLLPTKSVGVWTLSHASAELLAYTNTEFQDQEYLFLL